MTTQFEIPDASCGHCKATIESAVAGLDNVTRAELDLTTKRLTIEHGPGLDEGELAGAIRTAGYTPEPAV